MFAVDLDIDKNRSIFERIVVLIKIVIGLFSENRLEVARKKDVRYVIIICID